MGPSSGTDGRNTAIVGDRGLPYEGLTPRWADIGIDRVSRTAWVSSAGKPYMRGTVTGGGAVVQLPKLSTIDPLFPRVNGDVRASLTLPGSGDIVIGGNFFSVGTDKRMGNFAVIGAAGVRPELKEYFDAGIDTFAARGDILYVGGAFSTVGEPNQSSQSRPSFAAINHRTGKLLATPVLAGLVQRQTRVISIAVAPNSSLAALLVQDRTLPYGADTSVRIYDLDSGALIATPLSNIGFAKMYGVGNGMAAVRGIDTGANTQTLRLVNILTGRVAATYAAAGELVASFNAGDNKVRAVIVANGNTALVDLNPQNLSKVSALPLSMNPANTSGIVWMNGTTTVFENGQIMDSVTGRTAQMVNQLDGELLTASVSTRGLFIGGAFRSVFPAYMGFLLRVAEDGNLPDVATTKVTDYSPSLATTSRGLLMAVRSEIRLVAGEGDPVVIGTADRVNPPCISSSMVAATDGERVVVAGCWNSLTVGGETTTNRVVELDISSTPARIVASYPVDAADYVPRLAVSSQSIAVFLGGTSRRILSIDRATRQVRFTLPISGDVNGLELIETGGVEELIVGGWAMSAVSLVNNGLPPFNFAALLRVRMSNGSVTPVSWATRPVWSLTSGRIDGTGALFVGSDATINGVTRSLTRLNTADFTVRAELNLVTDLNISGLVLDGDRLWMTGDFQTLTFNGQSYRASGIAAVDVTALKVFTRGSIPVVTTTTAPAGELSAVDNAVPEAPPATIEVQPAPIPQDGTPTAGTYSVVDVSRSTGSVVVKADGTLEFSVSSSEPSGVRPMISRIIPVNKGLKVVWYPVKGATKYTVRALATGSRKSCSSVKITCTINGLNPWQAYTLTVESISGKVHKTSDASPKVKPIVKVRKNSSTSLRSIVPPGGKGAPSWKTTGSCKVARTNLSAPKQAGRCDVTVKVGKSTRTVRVNVG